jgi:flavodoxin
MTHDPNAQSDSRAGGLRRRDFLSGVSAGAALFGLGVGTPAIGQAMASGGANRTRTNTLILYLTRTRNTRAVAEIIHQEVGGTVVEVEPATPYPEDYDAIVAQVDEENESGYAPPLESNIENVQDYDAVFFGFPTWDMQLPPPMKSFLNEHDLSGKTIIPFNTNGGYGAGSSFQTVADLCPDSRILEGFSTRGGLERDGIYLAIKGERREEVHAEVGDWLQRIQVRP